MLFNYHIRQLKDSLVRVQIILIINSAVFLWFLVIRICLMQEELIELVDKEHKKIDKESTESAQLKENDKRDLSEGSKNDAEKVQLNVKETDSLKESSSKELECNKCEVKEGEGEKHECEETSNKKKDELDQTKDVSTDEDSTKSV